MQKRNNMKTNTILAALGMVLGAGFAAADATASGGGSAGGEAEDQQAELAKKLNNPVANLISVPIQNNWDFGIGSADAMKYTANIQPVIPISISQDWNLIVRTILPIIYAEGTTPGASSTSGLGDTVQSFFFSPKAPTSGGWIWGAARWRSGRPPPMTRSAPAKSAPARLACCSSRRTAGPTECWPITSGRTPARATRPT